MFEWWRKVRVFFHQDEIDADLEAEMKAPDAGDQRFRSQLLSEDCRDARSWPHLEGWIRDLRYGFRAIAKRRGFSATVILTLAIGIGATSAIFSLINAVVLRPLPFPDPERLTALHEARLSAERVPSRVAPARLEDWARLTSTFKGLAGYELETFAETSGVVPEQIHIASVSPRFFEILVSRPLMGRTFVSEEERFGGPKAIVISESLWRRRFGDNGELEHSLLLEGQSFVVVGVMPRTFQFPASTVDAWIATQADPELLEDRTAAARFYECIGRLKPGVDLTHAQADLDRVQSRLAQLYPKTDSGWGVAIEPLKDHLVGSVRTTLWLLFMSVGLLLLIACCNVACLLLSQLERREQEMSVRSALGASWARLGRQLLAEGLAYASMGGLFGAAIAFGGVRWLRYHLSQVPRITELVVDGKVLAFVTSISVAAAIMCSIAPIIEALRRNASLVRPGRGVFGGGQNLTRALVSAQLAIAMVLLVGAGLFMRTLLRVQQTNLGFQPDQILAVRISANFSEQPQAVVQRHQRTMDALSALPGVVSVAISHGLPGTEPLPVIDFRIVGEPANPRGMHFVRRRFVTAGYFQTLQIPLSAGETCRMNTDPKEEFQALVNKAFADRYLTGQHPIGRDIVLHPQESSQQMRIVGVVNNVHEEGYASDIEPTVYACGYLRWLPDSDFLIRTRGPRGMARSAREAIHVADPGRAVYSVRPLEDALSDTLSQQRFRTMLVGAFSFVALTLAAIGLYGVMAYMVARRTREFALRMALGATRGQIASEIARSAGRVTMTGAAVGTLLAVLVSRILSSWLTGIGISDVFAYSCAAGVLLPAALFACLIPGRRATMINLTEALREQ
jgi:putative ABC transport system permease protein